MIYATPLYVVAALEVAGALTAINKIGKPVRPVTSRDATGTVAVAGVMTAMLIVIGIHLQHMG